MKLDDHERCHSKTFFIWKMTFIIAKKSDLLKTMTRRGSDWSNTSAKTSITSELMKIIKQVGAPPINIQLKWAHEDHEIKAHSSWSWNENDDNSKNKTKHKSGEIKLHVYTISFSFVNCATWLLCNIIDNGNNVAQVQHLLQRLHLLRVPQLCHCSRPVCRHQPVPQSSLPSLWSWGSLNGVDNVVWYWGLWCWQWLLYLIVQVWRYYLLPSEEQRLPFVKNPMCQTFPRIGLNLYLKSLPYGMDLFRWYWDVNKIRYVQINWQ